MKHKYIRFRYMIVRLSIVLILMNCFFTGYSQSYNFKNYSVENGLPFIQIFSIFQDQQGYLWSSGYGGLSKFDGKKFTNYSPKNGLANHYVTSISSTNKGNLWIGTKSGLNLLINEKDFYTYTTKNGLASNLILSLSPDKENHLFVGTDKGLSVFKDSIFHSYKVFKDIPVKCLIPTFTNEILIGTSNGVYLLKNINNTSVKTIIANVDVNCFAINKTKLWIGTTTGLIEYDLQSGKHTDYGISNGLIDDNISTLTTDYKGNVWVGTRSGVMKFNGKQFLYYQISPENTGNIILSSTIDYEENIWFGTHAGLFKFRDEGFVSYGQQDGLTNTMVYPITRDNNNVLWIGTDAGGLFKYENNIIEQIKHQTAFGDTIYSFLKDGENLLIGNNKGLCVYQNKNFLAIKNLPSMVVFKVFKDSKNNYWLGSFNEVIRCNLDANLNATNIIHYSIKKDCQVWGIIEDNLGSIWVGAYMGGLYKFNGTQFENYNQKLNINSEDVFSLVKTKNGVIYAGSLDGVFQINPATMQSYHFTETNGLSSNLVYTLLLSNNDNVLWVGTNQGANKINLFEFNQTGMLSVAHYSESDGFRGGECNNGSWLDADGTVWFSTVSGIVRYNPNQHTINDKEAKLNFTKINLFYADTTLENNALLPHDLNNISFEYRGICLTNPDKVRYIHKLEGFDRFWSPETEENETRYSNLPPGNYTFKVRCCNNENIWNEPISFSFVINTPFYQKWWFVIACIGFVVSVIVIVFRIRINQLKRKQQIETEQQIEISKNQLKALRSQMNPHFMFNSLNSIQNFILANKDDSAVLYLNKFAKLMRMILNNSEKSQITLSEELDAMRLYIELEQMRFQNRFQYKITIDENIDPDYEQIPTMLMQPYVENAILHGLNPKKEGGLLQIDIRLAGAVMICSIIDNGIGREKSTEIKRNSTKEHISMGMKITKQRLQILNTMNNSNLSVRISDLKDEKGLPIGTKVDIFIPYT